MGPDDGVPLSDVVGAEQLMLAAMLDGLRPDGNGGRYVVAPKNASHSATVGELGQLRWRTSNTQHH